MPYQPKKRKDSDKWWVRGSYKDKKFFKCTGIPHAGLENPPPKVLKLAEKWEREHKNDVDEAASDTFGAAVKMYLSTGGSPRFIGPIDERLGHIMLNDITQKMIDTVAREIYPDVTIHTLNRQFYTPFIAVWSKASEGQRAIAKHVKWGRPKGSTTLRKVRKPVSYKDAVMFINRCPPQSGKIMFFLFWTGARPIEAINLECKNVDIKNRWLVFEDTKTGEPRGIPIHKSLIPMLKEELKHGGKVFRSSTGQEYADNRKRNKMGRIVSQGGGNFAASLKRAKELDLGITPYTARHTVSTYLATRVTQYEKDAILGHSRGVSGHYVHLANKELIKVIDSLPDAKKLGCIYAVKVYNGRTKADLKKVNKRLKSNVSNGAAEAD